VKQKLLSCHAWWCCYKNFENFLFIFTFTFLLILLAYVSTPGDIYINLLRIIRASIGNINIHYTQNIIYQHRSGLLVHFISIQEMWIKDRAEVQLNEFIPTTRTCQKLSGDAKNKFWKKETVIETQSCLVMLLLQQLWKFSATLFFFFLFPFVWFSFRKLLFAIQMSSALILHKKNMLS
jgi:hypothetical protein